MIQRIKITPNYPNQTVNFTANLQNFTLTIRLLGYTKLEELPQEYINNYSTPTFVGSIICQNVNIVSAVPVINRQPVNQFPSSMVGYIVAIDESGDDNPTVENLGVTCNFYYIDNLAELDNI